MVVGTLGTGMRTSGPNFVVRKVVASSMQVEVTVVILGPTMHSSVMVMGVILGRTSGGQRKTDVPVIPAFSSGRKKWSRMPTITEKKGEEGEEEEDEMMQEVDEKNRTRSRMMGK